jgi:hypothetical protein
MAQFYAGIPYTVPLATINRQVRTAHHTTTIPCMYMHPPLDSTAKPHPPNHPPTINTL